MVVEAPGPYNGPINQSNSNLLHLSPTQKSIFTQDLASGELHGYLRVWSAQPPNGNGVLIAAFAYGNHAQAATFQGGFTSALGQTSGVTHFSVPGVPGATGFTIATTTAKGGHGDEYVVGFTKGATAFEVYAVNASGALSSADATALAQRQWAALPAVATPATTATTTTSGIGRLLGAVVLVVLVVGLSVILVRRSKRRTQRVEPDALADPAPPQGTKELVLVGARGGRTFAPPSPYIAGYGPDEPGWVTDRSEIEEQVYWDGHAWSARRSFRSGEWVHE